MANSVDPDQTAPDLCLDQLIGLNNATEQTFDSGRNSAWR